MANQKLTDEDRKRIVDAYIIGESVKAISEMFQFKRPAIYAVIKKYKNDEEILLKKRGGYHVKKLDDSAQ
ncbi:hypothetical protein ENBRE01_2348 [Enteropsectra breve]|nr:hypothetical protein ENBRE01_2348 [Enteropsectra breve]